MSEQTNPPEEIPESEKTVFHVPGEPEAPEEIVGRVEGAFRYALMVTSGPQAGLIYVLGDGTTIAGRSNEADIFLGDVTVSRDHARFTVAEDGLSMEDLRSTNGTYVNGARHDKAMLQPGDEVIIGKFHLVVAAGHA
jgi:pSer/pThr/pTyr-binding forkhead associated (FHA) protein